MSVLEPLIDETSAQQAIESLAKESVWMTKALKHRTIYFKPLTDTEYAGVRADFVRNPPATRDQAVRSLGGITDNGEAYFSHLERTASLWKQYMKARNLFRLSRVALSAEVSRASAQVTLRKNELIEQEQKKISGAKPQLRDCFSCSFVGPNGAGYMSPSQYRSSNDNDMVEEADGGWGGGSMDDLGRCSRNVNIALDRCRQDLDAALLIAEVTQVASEGKDSQGYLVAIVTAGYTYWTCFGRGIDDFDICAMDAGFYRQH